MSLLDAPVLAYFKLVAAGFYEGSVPTEVETDMFCGAEIVA